MGGPVIPKEKVATSFHSSVKTSIMRACEN